jgi:hypothetical protein
MNKLFTEKMVEKELIARMKRSLEGWIHPEDDAEYNWKNNPEF